MPAQERWSVSFKPTTLASSERIVGFELRVRFGRITSIRTLPTGWGVKALNEASASLSGSVSVGAAALTDWHFFQDFVVVEKLAISDASLECEGLVIVTDDFEKTREIPIPSTDIILKKVPLRADGARPPRK